MADDKTRILSPQEAARLAAILEQGDDKTRVLSADEAAKILASPAKAPPAKAAATEDREPKFIGSKIIFFCENGHKITLDRSTAGKRGKCQGIAKQGCGVPFVVPIPPDFEPAPEVQRPAEEPQPPTADEPAEDPNPAGLAFDLGATEPVAEPEAGGPGWGFMEGGAPAADDAVEEAAAGAAALDLEEIDNPTVRMVTQLWLDKKEHDGVIEIHLSGGSVIMPQYFYPFRSCGTHAVFAANAADNTVTVTAVAWDQIQKIVLRRVPGLPYGITVG